MNKQTNRIIAASMLMLSCAIGMYWLSTLITKEQCFNNYSIFIISLVVYPLVYYSVMDKLINSSTNNKVKDAGPELLRALLLLKKHTEETSLYNDRQPPMDTVNKAISKAVEN